MKIISQIKQWLTRRFETIKGVSIIVLSVVVIFLLVNNRCSRDIHSDYQSEISELQGENNILQQDLDLTIHLKDSLKRDNERLKKLIYSSEVKTDSINSVLAEITRQRDELKEKQSKVPDDSIYNLLTEIYYTPTGSMKIYDFDAGQIRDIYWVTENYQYVSKENEVLRESIDELNFRITLKDSVNYNLITSNKVLNRENQTLEDLLKNVESQYKLSEDEIKRLKRQLTLQRVGFIVLAGAIIIIAI